MPFEGNPSTPRNTQSPAPAASAHKLKVDPTAIPTLRKTFQRALDKLTPEVTQARSDLRIRPWAGDPVSDEAAEQFNQRSVEGGDAALTALEGYQRQLQSTVESLQQVEAQYHAIEDDNKAMWNGGRGC